MVPVESTVFGDLGERILALTPAEWRSVQVHGCLRVPSPSRPECVYVVPLAGGPVRVVEAGRTVMELDVSSIVNAPFIQALAALLLQRALIEQGEPCFLRLARPGVPQETASPTGGLASGRFSGRKTWRLLLRPGD
jgi:hypothetical protein